jgi:hypothetical protein
MSMLTSQETPLSPAGLKFAEPRGFRFWIRPGTVSFDGLFALSVCDQQDGITTSAFPVVGYLGDFAFDWSVPEHAMSLVLGVVPAAASLQKFADVAARYGHEWLFCNAENEAAAIASSDADFVRQWLRHDSRFRGFKGIYFASNGRGCVKIGKSDNCLLSRLKSLQVANPDELRIVAAIPTPNTVEIEARLHQKHGAARLRGEWFAMTDADAVASAEEFGGSAFSVFLG